MIHLDDRVCEYVPSFGRRGKDRITIRHLVAHKADIPNLPPEALDLDLLQKPDHLLEILCEMRTLSRPGLLLAYHAVSTGFVLAELVQRATGESLREMLAKQVRQRGDALRQIDLHHCLRWPPAFARVRIPHTSAWALLDSNQGPDRL